MRSTPRPPWTALRASLLLCGVASGADTTILEHPASSPPERAGFGTSVVVLDFTGDGVADIAVGAPGESRVYVFLGAWGFQRHFVVRAQPHQPGDEFGYDLAAAPLDGVAGDELIVSAPGREVGGLPSAGAVFVVGRSFPYAPLMLVGPAPQAGASFGNAIAVADFDADGATEIAVGAPKAIIPDGVGGQVRGGAVVVLELDGTALLEIPNHFPRGDANYGHDLAAFDYDGDGVGDLVVSAPGNTSTTGWVSAGQVALQYGPLDAGGPQQLELLDGPDTAGELPPINQRFGMSVHGGTGMVLVGCPRRDIGLQIRDGGAGYLYQPHRPRLVLVPDPVTRGLMGYRARAADLVGDATPDAVFVALRDDPSAAGGVWIWDRGAPMAPPLLVPPPAGHSSHWAQGVDAGQVVAGGKQELVLGDSEWEPAGFPLLHDSGRVVVLELD